MFETRPIKWGITNYKVWRYILLGKIPVMKSRVLSDDAAVILVTEYSKKRA